MNSERINNIMQSQSTIPPVTTSIIQY